MKKHNSILFAAAAALMLVACENVQPGDLISKVELINYGEEDIEVPAEGGDFFISFQSSADWTISSSEDWVFVFLDSGKEGSYDVDFSVEPNETGDARSAVITVTLDAEHCFTVLVTQAQNNVFAVVNSPLSIGAEGGQLTFTVTGNIDYKVTPLADWISVVSTKAVVENTVTIEVAANEGFARESKVKVSSSEGDSYVKVSQEAGVTDHILGIGAIYYADYYEAGTASWGFNVFNEDYYNDGDEAMLYILDVSLPLEYDFFKLQADGIPEGVYTFNDSLEGFTFNSNSTIADYVTGDYVDITDGEIVVKDGVFAFTITDELGRVHKVKWQMDSEYIIWRDNTYLSSVTADYDVSFDTCYYKELGQYFIKEGIESYQMVVAFSDGNPQIGTSGTADSTEGVLLLSSATNDFTGTFTVEPVSEQNFTPGTVDGYNSYFGSYIGKYALDDGYFVLQGGTLTVTADGDGLLFEGEFTDDYPYGEPHKLKIHARGVVAPEEEAASSAGGSKIKFPRDLSARKARKANKYAITF